MTDDSTSPAGRVAFRVPARLMRRARAAVEAVRRAPEHSAHVEELVEVILELTDSGLDFYFLEPLRRAEVGVVASSSARLGIAAAGRGIPPIVRRVVSSLDAEQLLSIAGFMDEILLPEEDAGDGSRPRPGAP